MWGELNQGATGESGHFRASHYQAGKKGYNPSNSEDPETSLARRSPIVHRKRKRRREVRVQGGGSNRNEKEPEQDSRSASPSKGGVNRKGSFSVESKIPYKVEFRC